MSESNKALVRSFVGAINAQDWPRLRGLVADGFTRHSTAGGAPGIRSRQDLIDFLEGEYVSFPDATEAIEDLVAEGDKVAARHWFRGTQTGPLGPYPASGRVLEATYLAIYRIEDRRIAEAWAEWDNLAGLRQLGHAPAA
jgi:steroid delta-isomerase-like uncharacterized protein